MNLIHDKVPFDILVLKIDTVIVSLLLPFNIYIRGFFELFLLNYHFNIILYLIYHLFLFCEYVKISKSCLLIKNSILFKVSHFFRLFNRQI